MCTPAKGAPWFALSFIRDARQNARADFIRSFSGNGRGWRVLQTQGWRIVRVKVVEWTREAA
jgi:hypothetical protein